MENQNEESNFEEIDLDLDDNQDEKGSSEEDKESSSESKGSDTQLYARTKKAEAKVKEYEAKLKEYENIKNKDVEPDLKKDIEYLKLSNEKREFAQENGLSESQVAFAYKYNGNQKPTQDDLKNPALKAALKQIYTDEKVEVNTPHSKNSVNSRTLKTYGETATNPESSKTDRQEAFEKARKQRFGF